MRHVRLWAGVGTFLVFAGSLAAQPAALPGAGPLAPELLGSVNLVPQALVDSGFEFRDHDVTEVLASGLAGRR